MVSIIIPTFNRAGSIKDSVLSVLNQTYRELECIVVDDASTDDTQQIINSIKDPRLVYVKKSKNEGPSKARNIGIRHSNGDYIAFNDSDDIWLPDKLDKQLDKFNDEMGLVYCAYVYNREQREIKVPSDGYSPEELEGEIFGSLWSGNKIGTPAILVKKSCLDRVGGFKEELTSLEDWEFVLRIASLYPIGYVDEVLVRAGYSADGVNANIEGQIDTLLYLIKEYRNKGVSLENKIKLMLDRLGMVKSDSFVRKYMNQLVPEVFSSETEFLRLVEFSRENAKLKRLNHKLMELCDNERLSLFIKENIDIVYDKVAIYGAGEMGMFLARRLRDEGLPIQCIIDRNQIASSSFLIVKPEALDKDVNVVISTIVSGNLEWVRKLWKRNIRIINLFEV